MLINRFFVSVGAIMALGFTATAQQPIALDTHSIGTCKAMLPENYPTLPDEMRELAGKGAMMCIATLDERIAAQEKLEAAAKNLAAAIADEKSSVMDIARLKLDYLDAFVGISTADRPMHKPNFEASMRYFDLIIAQKKAGKPLDDATQAAYGKWQTAMLAAESHAGPDKALLAKADEAQSVREIAETAEFKKAVDAINDMMLRDEEMMCREFPNVASCKKMCADGSKPDDKSFCADGREPMAPAAKKK